MELNKIIQDGKCWYFNTQYFCFSKNLINQNIFNKKSVKLIEEIAFLKNKYIIKKTSYQIYVIYTGT